MFNIPGYQRPFSWEEDNFKQLFDDLNEARINNEDIYFLGSIILQVKSEEKDGSGLYDVVDGQQRLTTLAILLAVMRDVSTTDKAINLLQSKIYQEANEYEKKAETVRLKVRDKDKQFFRKYVLEKGGTKLDITGQKLSNSQEKIKIAIEVFKNKFLHTDRTVNQQLLDEMIIYVLNNAIMVYVKTSNLTSAFRLFSVLNARGMELTTSDLLKSENLAKIVESDREEFRRKWETMEDELGREELEKLIAFIRTIFIKEKARKSIYEEYNDLIYKKDPLFKGKNFVNYLSNVSEIYKEKVQNSDISYQNDAVMFYNLMTLMRDYLKFTDWIPVFILFNKKYPYEQILLPFLKRLEKKVVGNWIRGLSPTERIVDMNRVLSLIEKSKTVDDVLNHNTFKTDTYESEFETIINDENFYSRNFCKYVLLRLDLSLSENSNVQKAYKSIISIEHILPQKPSSGSSWIEKFNDGERNLWTNRIGNLVLLSRKKNSSANNKPFNEKKESYFKKGLTDFEITKEIMSLKVWDLNELKNRQEKCLNRIKNILLL